VISTYKVAVIGQPAERKDGHHDDEHPHHLQENTLSLPDTLMHIYTRYFQYLSNICSFKNAALYCVFPTSLISTASARVLILQLC
jgi:hypothetical protein